MDIPAFSRDCMSGSSRRRVTKYGTSKYDLEKVSCHYCGESISPGHGRHINSESQFRRHSSEGNYNEARDSSDATLVWEGESAYEKSQKKSYRSRSRSPAHRFDRASVNGRSGRIASFDFRNNEHYRTSTIPCKFFSTGNCRHGSYCRFSHNDWSHDGFHNYKPDDHLQGMDSRVYITSPRASDCYWDKYEGVGEQRAMRSSADDNGAPENSFMVHRMDSDEPTKNDGRSHLSLTSHSSSGMSVSESKGTAIRGADVEGSITCAENPFPTPYGTSRRPHVLDTVRSEAAASDQCQVRTEQISCLTNTLTGLLEDRKQLPELYAALSPSNALEFMQSSVSGSAGPDVSASSSSEYDPVTDSLELVKSVISEYQDGIRSELFLTGDGLYVTDCKEVELKANSLQSSEKSPLAGYKNKEQSILKAVKMKEEKDGGNLANNEGDGKAAEITKNNDGKSLRAFKFALAEFVKELLSPTWYEGKMNKEAYKTIVKKVVSKVTASVQSINIPETKEKIDNYISASKPKILKLVQAYIETVKKEKTNAA